MSFGDTLLGLLSRQHTLLPFLLVGTGAVAGRVRLAGMMARCSRADVAAGASYGVNAG